MFAYKNSENFRNILKDIFDIFYINSGLDLIRVILHITIMSVKMVKGGCREKQIHSEKNILIPILL